VIGEQWMNARNEEGGRRIDLEDDWVRIEIETALTLNKKVVPVLVGRATTPSAEELPPSIEQLSYRQCPEVP
jgi:hypothetical protein